MSLEVKIDALCGKIDELIAALGANGSGVAKSEKSTTRSTKSKPASTKKSDDDVIPDELYSQFFAKKYLALATDGDDRDALLEALQPIQAEFGVDGLREIKPEDRRKVLGYVKQLIEAFNADGMDGVRAHRFPFMADDDGDSKDPLDGI